MQLAEQLTQGVTRVTDGPGSGLSRHQAVRLAVAREKQRGLWIKSAIRSLARREAVPALDAVREVLVDCIVFRAELNASRNRIAVSVPSPGNPFHDLPRHGVEVGLHPRERHRKVPVHDMRRLFIGIAQFAMYERGTGVRLDSNAGMGFAVNRISQRLRIVGRCPCSDRSDGEAQQNRHTKRSFHLSPFRV